MCVCMSQTLELNRDDHSISANAHSLASFLTTPSSISLLNAWAKSLKNVSLSAAYSSTYCRNGSSSKARSAGSIISSGSSLGWNCSGPSQLRRTHSFWRRSLKLVMINNSKNRWLNRRIRDQETSKHVCVCMKEIRTIDWRTWLVCTSRVRQSLIGPCGSGQRCGPRSGQQFRVHQSPCGQRRPVHETCLGRRRGGGRRGGKPSPNVRQSDLVREELAVKFLKNL